MPTCRICYQEIPNFLGEHLSKEHNMSVICYQRTFPGAKVASDWVLTQMNQGTPRRCMPPNPSELQIGFAGITFPVHHNVPETACLKRPEHYRVPEYGRLAEDLQHLALVLADPTAPAVFIHGESGCGKDAAFHEWSGRTRRPGLLFQMVPETDIRSWFFSHELDQNGTRWEEGPLLKALRDGYQCSDGTVVPYLILITDFDRADRSQAEYLRLITDSIEGRVVGPNGSIHRVLDGTIIAATANSAGGGDVRGRYISVNPLDASILDRFEVGLQFHQMEWLDEEPVLQEKFPFLVERAPGIIKTMGRITSALRTAIANEDLYADFSHRSLCSICKHAIRLIQHRNKVPNNIIGKSVRIWTDKLPDPDTRQQAINIIDPLVNGGLLDDGGAEGVDPSFGEMF